MAEVKLKEEQELWEPQEVDNGWMKVGPDCGGGQSPHEAGPSLFQIKEEPEELQIKQESIQAFPVIVSVRSEKEEALLHDTMKEETRVDRDGESSSDTDDSGDWTPSAESPTAQTETVQLHELAHGNNVSGEGGADKPHKSSQCGEGLATSATLRPHAQSQTGESFKCSVCSRSYITRSRLETHMTIHTGEMPFRCAVCSKGFIKRVHLTSHMRIHTVQKPFKCSLCSKGFTKSGDLTVHMMVHTGAPFRCSVCSMAFMTTDTLEIHMNTRHPRKKLYNCPVCSKSFKSKTYVHAGHMKIHTGEKPFSCSVCEMKFARKEHLTAHMCTHTGGKPYKCPVCSQRFISKNYLDTVHMRGHLEQQPVVDDDQTVYCVILS